MTAGIDNNILSLDGAYSIVGYMVKVLSPWPTNVFFNQQLLYRPSDLLFVSELMCDIICKLPWLCVSDCIYTSKLRMKILKRSELRQLPCGTTLVTDFNSQTYLSWWSWLTTHDSFVFYPSNSLYELFRCIYINANIDIIFYHLLIPFNLCRVMGIYR